MILIDTVVNTPRVDRNQFRVTNTDGKEIEVVYASFAKLLEREANSLRQELLYAEMFIHEIQEKQE